MYSNTLIQNKATICVANFDFAIVYYICDIYSSIIVRNTFSAESSRELKLFFRYWNQHLWSIKTIYCTVLERIHDHYIT